MKKLVLGLTAASAIALTAAPALAQVEFYAGPGGVGVGFGAPGYYDYPYGYYGQPYGYYNYAPGWRWHHRYYRHHYHY